MIHIFSNRQTELRKKNERIEELELALFECKKVNSNLEKQITAVKSPIEFFNPDKLVSETERKKYVSDVALAYVTVFKKHFPEFYHDQMQHLSEFNHSDEEYRIYRCNINVFRLIEEWMIKLTNEHMGDLAEAREKADGNEEFISNMRDKYEV